MRLLRTERLTGRPDSWAQEEEPKLVQSPLAVTPGLSWKHAEQSAAPGLVDGPRCNTGFLESGQETLDPGSTLGRHWQKLEAKRSYWDSKLSHTEKLKYLLRAQVERHSSQAAPASKVVIQPACSPVSVQELAPAWRSDLASGWLSLPAVGCWVRARAGRALPVWAGGDAAAGQEGRTRATAGHTEALMGQMFNAVCTYETCRG